METGARVAKAVLACGKLSEIPCSTRDDVIIELECDSAWRLAVDRDIKLGVKILERIRDSKCKI